MSVPETGSRRESSAISRRTLMRGTTVASAALLTPLAATGAAAESESAGNRRPHFSYDVRANGAVGDGRTDDTAAFRATIAKAGAAGGGTVQVPAGNYVITGALAIPNGVSVEGVGWHSPRVPDSPSFEGSWIFVTGTGYSPIAITNNIGRGATIRKLAFNYPSQTTNPPGAYPAAITITSVDDVLVEDVHLYNPTVGIEARNAGRLRVHRVTGQPLKLGILIDDTHDTTSVTNIHFWPFWTTSPWTQQNGVGIQSQNNDNPLFSDIFCLGYGTGILFDASSHGATSKFHLQNCDLDACDWGIVISGNNTTGQMSNVTIQGPDSRGFGGMSIRGVGCMVQCANLRVTHVQGNGVRIEASAAHSRLVVHGLWVDGWAVNGIGFPAMEIVSGNTTAFCWLGVGSIFDSPGASGAPTCHPPSRFHVV